MEVIVVEEVAINIVIIDQLAIKCSEELAIINPRRGGAITIKIKVWLIATTVTVIIIATITMIIIVAITAITATFMEIVEH